jgi:hypothetical protein
MTKSIVSGCVGFLVCFVVSACPAQADPGRSHGTGHFQGPARNGVAKLQPKAGHELTKDDADRFQHNASLGLIRPAGGFRRAVGDISGLVRRPVWDQGRKTGRDGGTMSPELTKKNPRLAFLRRGPLTRREMGNAFADRNVTRQQVANFDRFLDLNPGIGKNLTQNPSLITNEAFLGAHRTLSAWLKAHPKTAGEIRESPRAFFGLEQRFEAGRSPERSEASNGDPKTETVSGRRGAGAVDEDGR